MSKYVLGLDFGTDSVRVLLADGFKGTVIATSVQYYTRWQEGKYCNPGQSQFRHHPLDYIESLELATKEVLAQVSPVIRGNVAALSVATTGSTPVAINDKGLPLSLLPEFSENPNAMFILWKDHTANAEAAEINSLSRQWETDFTKYSGGIYSSEWFWSKLLHISRRDEKIFQQAFSWVELCDWIPALLTGNSNPVTMKRSRCAAGHKAMWHEEFGGLPSDEFLESLDKRLKGLRKRLYTDSFTSDVSAGTLSAYWSKQIGLPANVLVGVGALDAHIGAVGACIEPFTLVKVMGTSTCDMLMAPLNEYQDILVKGICGQVNGSIIPGMLGMEAGQSAFGDLYNWFQRLLEFPLKEILKQDELNIDIKTVSARILPALSEKASSLPLSEQDIVATDWINGRRTPDADLSLRGAINGLHLGSDAPGIFKALVEATAFGSKAIVERFKQEGIPIKKVIALGGIAKKSSFVMQTLADVLNVPIDEVRSEQACALGAAMYAATIAGIHPNIETAQQAMGSGFETTYFPVREKTIIYETLYQKYCRLGSLPFS